MGWGKSFLSAVRVYQKKRFEYMKMAWENSKDGDVIIMSRGKRSVVSHIGLKEGEFVIHFMDEGLCC